MKHYLLTWYGITDLRAALGFGEGGGPVLGALSTGSYDEVIVLAYTAQEKQYDESLRPLQYDEKELSHQQQMEVIKQVSNTAEAHRVFIQWLNEALEEKGIKTKVRIIPNELSELNDTKGIHGAAAKAIELAAKDGGEKRMTFYISPGTPVMAFTWAFAALTNPELDIEIIASSQPGNPPETVELPYELLAPSAPIAQPQENDQQNDFDVVFHLLGEQRMPALLGIHEFSSSRHVFVTSGNYSSEVMKKFMPADSWAEIKVDPFDPMEVKITLLKEAAKLPKNAKTGFNLTGGTKLMFAGALSACRKVGGDPFYFETSQHRLVFLNDYSHRTLKGLSDCEDFLKVNDYDVRLPGRWEDVPIREQRAPVTQWLWSNRNLIAKLYRRLSAFNQCENDRFIPFDLNERGRIGNRTETLEVSLNEHGNARLKAGSDEFLLNECKDFAKYLSGGWIEEYVHIRLSHLLKKGKIRDLRIGTEVSREGWGGYDDMGRAVQEFDGLLTDGKRLIIIECKAGNINGEHLLKLQQIAETYGGHQSIGLIVGANAPRPIVRDRIFAARNVRGIYGDDVEKKLAALVQDLVQNGG